jgi:hypothetical protein
VRIYSDVTAERRALAEIERARSVAEEANCSKTRFLATMSHELRTPLNAVIGFSEALVDEVDPQNVAEFSRTILEAGRHLLSLIDEVLAVAQASAGALHMELRPLYIPSILEGTLRLMRPAAEAAGVALTLEPLPELLRGRADERRLRQILLNLIANALKFTPARGRVTVSAAMHQRRQVHGLPQRLEKAALIGDALAGDVEGGAVVHRGADHRQADRDVHAGLQPSTFTGPWPWSWYMATTRSKSPRPAQEEQRIGRQRAAARSQPLAWQASTAGVIFSASSP